MRKVLLLFLACFVVFPTFAIVMIPHGNPAIRQLQMNRAKEKREHIEKYHHGALAYDAMYYDKTERINKMLLVVTYEERRYFYVLDEIDKCTVKTEVHKIASRRATEKEIEAYGKQMMIYLIVLGLCAIAVLLMLIGLAFEEVKKKYE